MSGFSNPIIGSGDVLVRDAIQSENYIRGVSGWRITRAGDVEFNAGTFRSSLYVAGADGSFVKIQTSGSHADILMRPQDQSGDDWNAARITADVGDPGGIYPLNPALFLTGPWGYGMTSAPPRVVLIGPQASTDLNAIQVVTDNVDVFGSDGLGADLDISSALAMNVYGSLFCRNFGVVGGIGERQFVIQSGDQTNATTTLANTQLAFTVRAGATYEYRVRGAYDAPVATDIKLAWTTPATSIADKHVMAPDLGTATNIATSVLQIRRAMTTAQAVGAPNGVANGFTSYREDGLITASAAGTCTLQFAANAAGTATWRANSWVIAERVA